MFETKVHGKWILAGEHSVLRGCPALVFPLYSRFLTLKHTLKKDLKSLPVQDLQLNLSGEHGEELQVLFWGVLEKACELKKIRRGDIFGEIQIYSSIPVGAGLGASAALCVAVTQWLKYLKYVKDEEQQEFAQKLENLFHGESSGVDIAVAFSGKGLRYIRSQTGQLDNLSKSFEPLWMPRWYVSYSGKRGVTLECVKKVKSFLLENPEMGQKIDEQMKEAVRLGEEALLMTPENGLFQLKKSIELASDCFDKWGLVDGVPLQHMKWLKDQGALAVKPTGSGNGGYVLSLWDRIPVEDNLKKLIPCF